MTDGLTPPLAGTMLSAQDRATALSNPILRGVSPQVVEAMLLSGTVIERPEERYIMRVGSPTDHVYLLLSGAARVHARHADGREVLIKLLTAPALFGEVECILGCGSMTSVSTLKPTRLLAIPAAVFAQHVQEESPLALRLLRDVATRLRIATSNEADLAFSRVLPRLGRLLLDYASVFAEGKPADAEVWLPISQDDMARDLAVTRKAVTQALATLREENLVTKQGGRYAVVGRTRLAEFIKSGMSLVHNGTPSTEAVASPGSHYRRVT